MSEKMKDITDEELGAELARRRAKRKTDTEAEIKKLGKDLAKLVESFEKATGWNVADYKTWKAWW